jgi:predicted SAM-dependent methyltransferase
VGAIARIITRPLRNILSAHQLRGRIRSATSLRIIVGAGGTGEEGWIPTEQSLVDLLQPNTWANFFDEASVEAILAEHVWEHLTLANGQIAAETCFRFLKPGGYLRIAVPDGYHPSPDYIARVRPGGTGMGASDHQVLYNHHSFGHLFRTAGFDVRLIEYFDERGEFHTADWDVDKGLVRRSLLFDSRNQQQRYGYTSLFLDATKPANAAVKSQAA